MNFLHVLCAWIHRLWTLASSPVDDADYEAHLRDLPPC